MDRLGSKGPQVNRNISRAQFIGLDASLRSPATGELESYRGNTYDVRAGRSVSARDAWLVAEPGGKSRARSEHRPSHIAHFARERMGELSEPGGDAYLGLFVDAEPPEGEGTVDRDVVRYHGTRAAFKAMRQRPKDDPLNAAKEQKSAYNPVTEQLIYNPYHPVNAPRILKGLMESTY